MKSVGKRIKNLIERIFSRSVVRKREKMSQRALKVGTSPLIMDQPTESSSTFWKIRRKRHRQSVGTVPAAEY